MWGVSMCMDLCVWWRQEAVVAVLDCCGMSKDMFAAACCLICHPPHSFLLSPTTHKHTPHIYTHNHTGSKRENCAKTQTIQLSFSFLAFCQISTPLHTLHHHSAAYIVLPSSLTNPQHTFIYKHTHRTGWTSAPPAWSSTAQRTGTSVGIPWEKP